LFKEQTISLVPKLHSISNLVPKLYI
jgi:hypothetical protein